MLAGLADLWLIGAGWVLSFVMVGIIWASHHEMFGMKAQANWTLAIALTN